MPDSQSFARLHVPPWLRRFVGRLRLLDDVAVSGREIAWVTIALATIAAVVFGPHVAHGGFVYDDWALNANSHFASSFGDAFDRDRVATGNRVIHAAYLAGVHRVLGLHMHAHLAWITALAVLMTVSVYLVARLIRVERAHAFVIATLTLLAPSTDSNRLWITAAAPQLAVALAFGGIVVAISGLSRCGRKAIAIHALAIAMYVASLLLYEVSAGLIVVAFLLYRLRAPWRAALVRWPFDFVMVGLTLIYLRSNAVQRVQGFHGQIEHVRIIEGQARLLVGWLGIPFAATRIPPILMAGLLLFAFVLWRRLPRGRDRLLLGRWLAGIGAGVLLVIVGYVMFVPADPYYSPLSPGVGNRVNVLAAVGYAVFFYSFTLVIGIGLFRGLPSSTSWAAATAITLSAVLAIAYTGRLRTDAVAYDRSSALQKSILTGIREDVPKPRRGSAVYLFRAPAEASLGIPVFGASWDLTGALRLMWNDESVRGIPSVTWTELRCLPNGVRPIGSLYDPLGELSDYRHSIFVDSTSGRFVGVRGPGECRRLRARFSAPA